MFKCDNISVEWCFFILLNYYVLLRGLVRWKSLKGGIVAYISVGTREQAQGREELRDYRFGQANTHSRELGACLRLTLRLRVREELGKGSQATEVTKEFPGDCTDFTAFRKVTELTAAKPES